MEYVKPSYEQELAELAEVLVTPERFVLGQVIELHPVEVPEVA